MTTLVAPAKLTLSLRVVGRRADGYHDIEAEMVSVDLHDVLEVDERSTGLDVVAEDGSRGEALASAPDNIVERALAAVGRSARVRIHKRIPVGGGLGGGSADAAAILRWAGVDDPAVAARLGADVPFCVRGGRALVGGIGELVRPLPFEDRRFVLLVPPFSVETARVYAAWDDLEAGRAAGPGGRRPGGGGPAPGRGHNDLLDAALRAEPRLARWGAVLADATGREPFLAGSGSTWWVEGSPAELGLEGATFLDLDGDRARVLVVETVPAGWAGPSGEDGDLPGVR